MTDLDTIAAMMRRLLEQNATMLHAMSLLAAEVDVLKHHVQPPPDQQLLLALAAEFGEFEFTSAEAIGRGRYGVPALRIAIELSCQGRFDAKVLGHKLARLAEVEDSTPRLVCLRPARSGCLWRVHLSKVPTPKPLAIVAAA